MNTRTMPRITTFLGAQSQDARHTCGVCHKHLALGEDFAGVLYDGVWNKGDGLRETRCIKDCADWLTGTPRDLRRGDVLWTHRYQLTDWGPRIKAQVVHLTDDFNKWGARATWLMPADPEDQSPVAGLRAIGEHWATQMADQIGTVDPLPSLVWMPDEELIHYTR